MTELTREQVKETLGLLVHPDTDYQHAEKFWQQILDQDAALRARLEQVEQVRDEHYAAYIEATESEERLRDERDTAQARLMQLEQERDDFAGIFGDYGEPPRTVDQARHLWDGLKQQLAQIEDMANEREAFYAGELNAAETLRCAQRERITQMEEAYHKQCRLIRFLVDTGHKWDGYTLDYQAATAALTPAAKEEEG